MKYLIPILLTALTLATAAAGALTVPAGDDVAVAAVFPPWWGRERAAAAVAGADGLIVREGAVGSILIVRSGSPLLADRLRDRGAVLVVNPIVAGGCLIEAGPAPVSTGVSS